MGVAPTQSTFDSLLLRAALRHLPDACLDSRVWILGKIGGQKLSFSKLLIEIQADARKLCALQPSYKNRQRISEQE